MVGATLLVARASVVRVAGDSMVPTLHPGDAVVTIPRRWRRRPPAVGRVVVVVDPAGREVVKRVCAGAGDWTDVMDGPLLVPDGHVAVRGDAPGRSTDSRHYGPLPEASVRATAVVALSRHRPHVRMIRTCEVQRPL